MVTDFMCLAESRIQLVGANEDEELRREGGEASILINK